MSPLDTTADPAGKQLADGMIWGSSGPSTDPTYVAFRKSFDLPADMNAATAHVFADSRYVLWVNGKYVGRGPVRFVPNGPQFDTIDLGPKLVAGRNSVVALVLGWGRNGKMMKHVPGFAMRIEMTGGGRAAKVQTDTSWRWTDRTYFGQPKLTWPGIQDRLDATRESGGDWTQPSYDDSAWQPAHAVDGAAWGPLTACRTPALRETDVPLKFDAPLPRTLATGETCTFDAGHLVQAYTEVEIDAEAGATLQLPHASASYMAKAGQQTFFTFDTCSFANGSVKVTKGKVTLKRVRVVERLYPFDVVGFFHCSDAMLDRLWGVCVRSLQVLSEDAYVDCADRERVEWMDCDPPDFDVTRVAVAGPAVNGRPAYSDPRLLAAMLRRTALTLQPDGWVKAHTCSDRFDIHAKMEDRACDWVSGIRRYLESTGDTALVREVWPAVRAQLDYFLRRRTERGLVNARDWETWGNPTGYQTFEAAGLNAFIYRALADGAYLAEKIGNTEDAATFSAAARQLGEAYNKVLWDETPGTYFTGYWGPDAQRHPKRTVTLKKADNLFEPTGYAALFALDQGIVPDERRPRVSQYLLAHPGDYRAVMPYHYLFRFWYGQDS
ncbi:MAG: alpha-L-rhamnosidase-related protein, partial [Tepidisphaeraceae bacterium]